MIPKPSRGDGWEGSMGLTPMARYEDLLGDGLEALLGQGTDDLGAFAEGLNARGALAHGGKAWDAAALESELRRLAADADRMPYVPAAEPPFVSRPFVPQPKTTEERLAAGLLNLWYLVARSSDLIDRPLALKRLDRNLVLWRDAAGAVQAVENYCPHRGAPLSMGEIRDGMIVCPYHGVQVTGAGVVADVPPTPSCPMVGQKAVRSYPCREFADAIWIYFSDDQEAAVPEPIWPDSLTSPDWTSFLYTGIWDCNWQLVIDNRTDPVHGSYLHAGTFTLSFGRKDTELKIEPKPHGFETYRSNQRGVNIDWHEVVFHPDNIYWVRTEIPYPPAFGGGSFFINGFATPIDRDTTYFWVYRSRQLSGWRRDLWRFLYRNRLEERAAHVLGQDRVLLEAMSVDARQREFLLQTDTAMARMRRHLKQQAQRQTESIEDVKPAAE
jgi:phenylpropionate dioxygenase-like ring-hydroxylating dioxygenase large terminal subunit